MPFKRRKISALSGTIPNSFFASKGWVTMFLPLIKISPSSGDKIPLIILIVVVFPAPFGPINPMISPVGIVKLILSTALWLPL